MPTAPGGALRWCTAEPVAPLRVNGRRGAGRCDAAGSLRGDSQALIEAGKKRPWRVAVRRGGVGRDRWHMGCIIDGTGDFVCNCGL